RVMDNVAVGTRNYSIRDGSLVGTGKPSRWQSRCEADGVGAFKPSSAKHAMRSGGDAYPAALPRTIRSE
uniref:hypothetical protein n=1 Tax=Klebsiella pneumoniae TaxID=573 RepID=UPI001953BAA9